MNKIILCIFSCFLIFSEKGSSSEDLFPIQFSISESKIVKDIPFKDQDFAFIIPGELDTYIYTEEKDYYADYQRSYFAVTCAKGGWDCLRHYEILANGCIPYFVDIDKCNPDTMKFLPKELILEAMHLPGVSYRKIDHRKFDKQKYASILARLLDHTRKYLSSKNMAQYFLDMIHYKGNGKILYLSQDPSPDYLRCCMLIGFKELLGDRVVDFPKIEHVYKNYPNDVRNLYGKGFTYTKIVDDFPVNREDIEQRIQNREFDLIIYGSVHRGLPFHDLVLQHYTINEVAYMCGEDAHKCEYVNLLNFPSFFLREFDAK